MQTSEVERKPGLRWWQWGLIGFGALAVYNVGWQLIDPEGHAAWQAEREAARQAAVDADAAAELAEAQTAEAEREKGLHCLTGWDGSNLDVVQQTKAVMRNPKSFDHVETAIYPNDAGEHGLWMTFRAENGFGGMNVERIYARVDHETCNARLLPDGPGSG